MADQVDMPRPGEPISLTELRRMGRIASADAATLGSAGQQSFRSITGSGIVGKARQVFLIRLTDVNDDIGKGIVPSYSWDEVIKQQDQIVVPSPNRGHTFDMFPALDINNNADAILDRVYAAWLSQDGLSVQFDAGCCTNQPEPADSCCHCLYDPYCFKSVPYLFESIVTGFSSSGGGTWGDFNATHWFAAQPEEQHNNTIGSFSWINPTGLPAGNYDWLRAPDAIDYLFKNAVPYKAVGLRRKGNLGKGRGGVLLTGDTFGAPAKTVVYFYNSGFETGIAVYSSPLPLCSGGPLTLTYDTVLSSALPGTVTKPASISLSIAGTAPCQPPACAGINPGCGTRGIFLYSGVTDAAKLWRTNGGQFTHTPMILYPVSPCIWEGYYWDNSAINPDIGRLSCRLTYLGGTVWQADMWENVQFGTIMATFQGAVTAPCDPNSAKTIPRTVDYTGNVDTPTTFTFY
jgi:hypothetical protein